MRNTDIARLEKIKIKIRGEWNPEIYDTLTGEVKECAAEIKDGNTLIE